MAAELGDIAPRSYIGQPLAADIELLSLSPEELAQGLQVRLALADVYRGANVMMNPALATVKLAVEKRGARSVLHVTTTRPVEADYVHVFVEMGLPGKQQVRLATVWLQHDPNPAPAPPVPLATTLTPAQAEQVPTQARAARTEAASKAVRPAIAAAGAAAPGQVAVAAGTGAGGGVAAPRGAADDGAPAPAAPLRDRSKPAPLPSLHEAETGKPGEVKAAAGPLRRIAGVLVTPDGKPVKPSYHEDAPAEVPMQVAQALLPLAPLPLPRGVKRPAPASCPSNGISAKECVALDSHNTEIAGKLSELEAKLKALQGALGTAVPAAARAAVPAAVAASAAAHGPASAAASAAAGSAAASGVAAGSGAGAHGATAATGAAAAGAGHGETPAKSSTPTGSSKAELKAKAEAEMHAAMAEAKGGAAAAELPASAAAGAEASAPPVATKQVRVLPKLKYKNKKDKPAEQASDNTLPLVAGGVGVLALLGAGLLWWRAKKGAGRGPLKIWQGFRNKGKAVAPPQDEEFKPVNDGVKEAVAH